MKWPSLHGTAPLLPHSFYIDPQHYRLVESDKIELDEMPHWDDDGNCSVEYRLLPACITAIVPAVNTNSKPPFRVHKKKRKR